MKLRHLPIVAIALATASFPLIAAARLAATGVAVRFVAVGPAGLKIVGTGSEGSVDDDGTTVKVKVPLASVTTGIALRDKHMRDKYLQVATFPEAELDVTRSAIGFPKPGAESAGDVPGVLRLHGQNKTAVVHYTAKRDGERIHVRGTVHVNLGDFGIEEPKYMGLSVKPDVEVEVQFDASDR